MAASPGHVRALQPGGGLRHGRCASSAVNQANGTPASSPAAPSPGPGAAVATTSSRIPAFRAAGRPAHRSQDAGTPARGRSARGRAPTRTPGTRRSPVLRPAPPSGILPLHSRPTGCPLLDVEAGLVSSRRTVPVAQVLDDVIPQVIADAVDVPVCAAQQPLHAIRAHLARALVWRSRPFFRSRTRDQPVHTPGPVPRLRAPEPARNPLMHPVQLRRDEICPPCTHDAPLIIASAVAVLRCPQVDLAEKLCSNVTSRSESSALRC